MPFKCQEEVGKGRFYKQGKKEDIPGGCGGQLLRKKVIFEAVIVFML